MYRFQRSMELLDQKAWAWSKEVTAYINKLAPDVELVVFTGRFGQQGIIYWMADVEDLNALDSWQNKISADEGYQKMVTEASGYFVQGTMVDKVFQEL